jgi:hypothetical protein
VPLCVIYLLYVPLNVKFHMRNVLIYCSEIFFLWTILMLSYVCYKLISCSKYRNMQTSKKCLQGYCLMACNAIWFGKWTHPREDHSLDTCHHENLRFQEMFWWNCNLCKIILNYRILKILFMEMENILLYGVVTLVNWVIR